MQLYLYTVKCAIWLPECIAPKGAESAHHVRIDCECVSDDRGNNNVKRLEMIINHIRRYINRVYYY